MKYRIIASVFATLAAVTVLAVPQATASTDTVEDTATVEVIDWVPGSEPIGTATEDAGAFAPYRFGKYGFPDTSICLESRLNGIAIYQDAVNHAAAELNSLPDVLAWARPSGGCDAVPLTRKVIYTFYNGGADGRCAYNLIHYNPTTHVVLDSTVKINTYYYSVCQQNEANRFHVELHEATHAFGLNHTTATSVMNISVWIPDLSTVWDDPHLNQLYHD